MFDLTIANFIIIVEQQGSETYSSLIGTFHGHAATVEDYRLYTACHLRSTRVKTLEQMPMFRHGAPTCEDCKFSLHLKSALQSGREPDVQREN